MTKLPVTFLALMVCVAMILPAAVAQESEGVEILPLREVLPTLMSGKVQYQLGNLVYDGARNVMTGTNGVYINFGKGEAVLTADTVEFNYTNYDVEADGNVRLESTNMLWVGDHIRYNYKTHVMTSGQFRLGRPPLLAAGQKLSGFIDPRTGATNQLTAAQAFFTTDDSSDPDYVIRATRIRIIPGKKIQMWNAVAYIEGVPVFYFPYYERRLGPRANHWTFTPGYRSAYGPYLLNTYNWFVGDVADGRFHADYRERRGPGAGPDVDLHLGRWGDADVSYYYQYDKESDYSTNAFPYYGNIPKNRQRFYLGWQASPVTNLNLKAMVNYQSDPLYLHDFFPSVYTANPQPNTFVEANKYWENWSLDALTTPRVNSFFSQIEREPDVQLTGYRQQVLDTPVYYDSQSSAGWYRAFDAFETNGLYPGTNGFYSAYAARADTFHQLTLPLNFFNWLNVTPRVGGRLTYYSSENLTNGQPNGDVYREVFNTGVAVSFKASQLWPDVTNSWLQLDGLRHIIEPSADYVFVPDPSTPPAQLPPFDAETPSLLLSPLEFPDYNSIDSVDTMNVIRFGLRNVLQTRRNGQITDLVNWNLLLDWRLDPKAGQTPLNDLYSALAFHPRNWIGFESQVRYDLDRGNLNMAFHEMTLTPNDRWSWGVSHWYLRAGFVSPDENDYLVSTLFYRVNDNWGLRAMHIFNAVTGRLQEQDYTVMRDMRSWTAALTFRVQNNVGIPADFTVAFTFSIKALPSTRLGEDSVTSYHLVGE